MDLMNEQVTHRSFGTGSVVAFNEEYVEVRFPAGVKKFVFPDVFGTYLTLADPMIAKKIEVLKKEVERERHKEEAELEKQRAREKRASASGTGKLKAQLSLHLSRLLGDPEEQEQIFQNGECSLECGRAALKRANPTVWFVCIKTAAA